MRTVNKYTLVDEYFDNLSQDQVGQFLLDCIGTKEEIIEFIYTHFPKAIEELADEEVELWEIREEDRLASFDFRLVRP